MVKLPAEAGGGYAVLERTLYGTRDAANAWADEIKTLMLGHAFEQGKSSPCVYVHKPRELKVAVHGDDFVVLGPWRQVSGRERFFRWNGI